MELAGAKVYGALPRRARVPNCPRASLSARAVAPSRAQSADAHLDDLRDNVQRTLEHTGVLSEIRARLRAAVITAIMDGEPTDPPTVGLNICSEARRRPRAGRVHYSSTLLAIFASRPPV